MGLGLNRHNLERFIALRNQSKDKSRDGFLRDLAIAGIRLSELGQAFPTDGWFWQTPFGDVIEDVHGHVRLTAD